VPFTTKGNAPLCHLQTQTAKICHKSYESDDFFIIHHIRLLPYFKKSTHNGLPDIRFSGDNMIDTDCRDLPDRVSGIPTSVKGWRLFK
jgi:hypothetical protein